MPSFWLDRHLTPAPSSTPQGIDRAIFALASCCCNPPIELVHHLRCRRALMLKPRRPACMRALDLGSMCQSRCSSYDDYAASQNERRNRGFGRSGRARHLPQRGERLLQLLARLTLNPGKHTANQPTRLAHLDDGNHGAILVQGDEGLARVIRLGHQGTPSVRCSDDGAISLYLWRALGWIVVS